MLAVIGCRTPQKERDHFIKHSNFISALLFAALLLLSGGNALAQGSVATDREALVALYDATDGANWKTSTNWKTTEPLSTWHGVTTDANGRVTGLSLAQNELSGAIPAELGNLSNLQELWLSRNELSGTIPVELGALTNLQRLSLLDNMLTGEIPAELENLSNLQELFLSANELSGEIPAELGNLSNLQELFLSANELSGAIPAELGNLSNLQELWLSRNGLSGTIPVELGALTNLQRLSLLDNMLTGEIPAELRNLTNLQELWLWGNELSGEIPAELGNLSSLQELWLGNNELTGEIPVELNQLTQLRRLYLGGNQLTGEIPTKLGHLYRLEYLNLSGNQLTGTLPEWPTYSTHALRWLDLSGNQLTGSIPEWWSQLGQLELLDLSDNQLTGTLPEWLRWLTQLRRFDLSGNQLMGEIPEWLSRLSQLQWLDLSDNQLTGSIPAWLGRLSQLRGLHLQNNQLTGPIPTELGRLSNLEQFSFRGNRLTGPVPTPLSHLPDVYVLDLAANWVGPVRMKVTWDDPGDSTASYTYRLWEATSGSWTDWAEILETTLRAGEGVTIEWTLTGLPTDSTYTYISVRARNRSGFSPEALARVGPLETPVDTPESEPLITFYFPDYVDGGGWSVQLALSHIAAATEDAEIIVTVYDREGQPIPGFFDFDDPFEIPPLGTRILRSAGPGEIRRGWIEVQTDTASVSGLLTYRNAATGLEVSIEPGELARHFALFVEESSGIGTGLAIFKPDPASTIEFRIRDEDGVNPLGEGFARVGDFNQAARTIPEWFAMDGIDTEFLEDFRGVLFLRAEDGSLFAPLGLRFGKRGESLSAVPVIRVTGVPE